MTQILELSSLKDILYWLFTSFLIIWPSVLLSFFIKKKPRYWLRITTSCAFFTAYILILELNGIIYFNTWWVEYTFRILSFLVFVICSDCSLKEKCYLEVWSIAMENLMAQLPGLLATSIDPENMQNLMKICRVVTAVVFYVIAALIIKFCTSRNDHEISWWEVAQAAVVTIAVAAFNRYIFRRVETNLTGDQGNLGFFLQAFAALCVMMVLFMQLEIHYRKKLEMDTKLKERIWSLEKKQFEERKEQIDLINRKCHDLKHQIAALEFVSDKSEYKRNILELKNAVQMYDEDMHTGNLALETIIKEKKLQYEQEGVTLKCVVNDIPKEFMDVVDLYVLLGNILDNALESIKKLDRKNDQIVEMHLYRDRNMIRLISRNRYDGELHFQNGLPVSTKDNNGYHGFGLQSIRNIVEKYKGAMTIDTENEVFLLKILIPIPMM